ncbi:MAG: hypothetical protein ACRCZF_18530, partial [Gemmataceae bacterium]
DITGDGRPELIITPDEGGGPRVDAYNLANNNAKVASFFGIDDTNFRGGARATVADMNADAVGDVIVAAGFQGGPRVAGFSGKQLTATGDKVKVFGDFFAFEQTLRNGTFVTAGDVNGDGFADLIVGGGPGGGPRVTIFNGKDLLSNQYTVLNNFFAGDDSNRGGVRIGVRNIDNDTKADLVVGAGTGAGSTVTIYAGTTLDRGTATPLNRFEAVEGFRGGIFVG